MIDMTENLQVMGVFVLGAVFGAFVYKHVMIIVLKHRINKLLNGTSQVRRGSERGAPVR